MSCPLSSKNEVKGSSAYIKTHSYLLSLSLRLLGSWISSCLACIMTLQTSRMFWNLPSLKRVEKEWVSSTHVESACQPEGFLASMAFCLWLPHRASAVPSARGRVREPSVQTEGDYAEIWKGSVAQGLPCVKSWHGDLRGHRATGTGPVGKKDPKMTTSLFIGIPSS